MGKVSRARVKCPYCNKKNVRLVIKARGRGLSGVTGTLSVHDGLHVNPETGKNERCSGSGQTIPNRDLPPMSEWK